MLQPQKCSRLVPALELLATYTGLQISEMLSYKILAMNSA